MLADTLENTTTRNDDFIRDALRWIDPDEHGYRVAFNTLIAPARGYLRKLDSATIRELGRAALERYFATESVCLSDYADIGTEHEAKWFAGWRPSNTPQKIRNR